MRPQVHAAIHLLAVRLASHVGRVAGPAVLLPTVIGSWHRRRNRDVRSQSPKLWTGRHSFRKAAPTPPPISLGWNLRYQSTCYTMLASNSHPLNVDICVGRALLEERYTMLVLKFPVTGSAVLLRVEFPVQFPSFFQRAVN